MHDAGRRRGKAGHRIDGDLYQRDRNPERRAARSLPPTAKSKRPNRVRVEHDRRDHRQHQELPPVATGHGVVEQALAEDAEGLAAPSRADLHRKC